MGLFIRGSTISRGIGLVDPRPEVGRLERRKRQQQVAEIALRIDGDHRDAVDRGFLDQADAETGLPA
ncbi:MAG: hypothetical protein GWM91_29805, partial [Actinobacteria bacterium]|nr:hypothetical protein [Actinomycetota bacterium]NIV59557.1 hypothetical protein [Actinomycetota bacterium]NIX54315.1 hypothetical protein [Actinomycetota bacterium]